MIGSPSTATRTNAGRIARWTTHWSFWPFYSAFVLLLIYAFRPWETFRLTDDDAPVHKQDVRIHDAHEVPGSLSVGTVALVRGDLTALGGDWLPCDGRVLATADHPELASRLGPRFEVDRDSFALPRLPRMSVPPARSSYTTLFSIGLEEEPATAADADAAAPVPLQICIRVRP